MPGPVAVPKSPCDLAQTCSRFQSSTPPPFVDFGRDSPEYRVMTSLVLFGSSSVSLSAVHTWSYVSVVWSSMMSWSEALSALPVFPTAGA